MTEETLVALKNYEHLINEHGPGNVRLVWHTDTLLYGPEGFSDIDILTEPGFTPATECFTRAQSP